MDFCISCDTNIAIWTPRRLHENMCARNESFYRDPGDAPIWTAVDAMMYCDTCACLYRLRHVYQGTRNFRHGYDLSKYVQLNQREPPNPLCAGNSCLHCCYRRVEGLQSMLFSDFMQPRSNNSMMTFRDAPEWPTGAKQHLTTITMGPFAHHDILFWEPHDRATLVVLETNDMNGVAEMMHEILSKCPRWVSVFYILYYLFGAAQGYSLSQSFAALEFIRDKKMWAYDLCKTYASYKEARGPLENASVIGPLKIANVEEAMDMLEIVQEGL